MSDTANTETFESWDVTEMPPEQRHKEILERFTSMGVEEGFILVNDHDPKPLFYELRSIHGDTFDWEYEKQEPGDCRVRIQKTEESNELPQQASTRVDVREIPPHDRHKSIFHRYDLLAEGDAMEIVADHDPTPLRHQLQEIEGDNFSWEYLEKENNLCRVLLTKTGREESAEESEVVEESESIDTTDHVELDVRERPPAERHQLIFDQFNDLSVGDGFVIVNDHDPKPLYYQLKEEADCEIRWEYLKQDEGEWKVLLGKNE
ncbi:MAG: DUF2249 domain-containing protein [bacterium]